MILLTLSIETRYKYIETRYNLAKKRSSEFGGIISNGAKDRYDLLRIRNRLCKNKRPFIGGVWMPLAKFVVKFSEIGSFSAKFTVNGGYWIVFVYVFGRTLIG